MRAVVTGCAGFIGSHLVESLLDDGYQVLGVDCFNDNYSRQNKLANLEIAQAHDAFEFVSTDLTEGDLSRLLDGQDVLFHLAGEPGVRASWGGRFDTYLRNNLLATQRLLEAAREWTGTRFVYASSSSIYGQAESLPTKESTCPQPFSPYGMTKLGAEQLCGVYHANFGVPTVSLRYFSVYGPRQRPDMAFTRFCLAGLASKPITVFGDGEQTRDFTYVSDIVAATRAAATTPHAVGRIYNVGGGAQVSLLDTLALLEQLMSVSLEIHHLKSEQGDVRNTGADITRARQELRFIPAVSLDQGLAQQIDWAHTFAAN